MGQAVQPVIELQGAAEEAKQPRWGHAKKIAFRFVCVYFLLYNLPAMGHVNLLSAIPGISWLSEKYIQLWHAIVPWVAIHVFHLSGPVTVYPAMNGSGDTTLDYIENLCLVMTAAMSAIIWSVLDRKRSNYSRLHFYLR